MKKLHTKPWGVFLVVLMGLCLLLAACGTESYTPTPASAPISIAPASTGQIITLKWSYWGSDAEVEINKKIVAQFERLNPTIKIEQIFVPFEKYFDKFKTDWVGDKSPDVMFLYNIPNYASLGLLENLEPYLQRDKDQFNLADFYPNLLSTFRFARLTPR